MTSIEKTLCEIEYLMSKKTLAKYDLIPQDEYIDLLTRLKTQYHVLAHHYESTGEHSNLFQAILIESYTIIDISKIKGGVIPYSELHRAIDLLRRLSDESFDVDLCRSAFSTIGKLYYYLGEYELAETNIRRAIDDYDYSVTTFSAYMQILDAQKKYLEIISSMKSYLEMSVGYHSPCTKEDFILSNIQNSTYYKDYVELFDIYKRSTAQ